MHTFWEDTNIHSITKVNYYYKTSLLGVLNSMGYKEETTLSFQMLSSNRLGQSPLLSLSGRYHNFSKRVRMFEQREKIAVNYKSIAPICHPIQSLNSSSAD